MAEKNSFVLQNRMNAIVAKLSDNQAGILFKAVLNYAENGVSASFKDGMVDIAFMMFKQDIDYANAKYQETCEKRAAAGRKGGAPAGNNNANKQNKQMLEKQANALKNKQNKHNDVVVDVDNDIDKLQLLTAASAAGQAENPQKPRKLNNLQEFSNRVIAEFEDLQTQDQISVWFKRNCRNLSDILKFCGGDIDIALECIAVCVERLEKAGLKGGYEAVCRNLPDYYREACQRVKARVKNAQENN